MTLRIGLDVGGTFTDLCAVEAGSGRAVFHKRPSTPDNPADGILAGLRELLALAEADGAEVAFLGHGTTHVTNMIIERRGARLGVVTTRGFRDVLEIGRQARPHLYDYRHRRPPPLARRALRREVGERLAADGTVLTPLDEADLEAAAALFRRHQVEAVAVCFLHAYRNPEHEARAVEMLREALPDAFITASSAVAPEFREYERFSTAAINAFVGPRAARYLDDLIDGVAGLGITRPLYTVSSNGGLLDGDSVRATPVRTALSGPAAGVVGACRIMAPHGVQDFVTFDVGGTSTDIALVADGRPRFARSRDVAGHPLMVPMVDMDVIGAGGGSLAVVDAAGGLQVGPRSAGAEPGPIAYVRGGTIPTLTDACLILGRLSPAGLLGGAMALDLNAAAQTIESDIAARLNLDMAEAALGIVRIAVANMSRAIRSAILRRGYEPAQFALVAYGGAGPLVACDVARSLGMKRVAVPVSPGTVCARAILEGDLVKDDARTVSRVLDDASWGAICSGFAELRAAGEYWLEGEGIEPADRAFEHTVEARYLGQNFELGVRYDDLPEHTGDVIEAFTALHEHEQGIVFEDRPIEAVTIRLRSIGRTLKDGETAGPHIANEAGARPPDTRRVRFEEGEAETGIVDRMALAPGDTLAGPVIIEEMSATTVVPPGFAVTVAGDGTLFVDAAPS